MFKQGDKVVLISDPTKLYEIHRADNDNYYVYSLNCASCKPYRCSTGSFPMPASLIKLKDETKMSAPSNTLEEAVKSVVDNFIDNDQAFSIFDITSTLRNDANNGDLEVPECEVTGMPWKYQFEHRDVKGVLELTGYLNDGRVTRNFNRSGGFFVYTPVTGSITALPGVISGWSIAPSGNASFSNASTTGTPLVKLDRPAVLSRMRIYLTNAKRKGFLPTLKQMQSAIKRGKRSTGWSKKELAAVVAELNI